MLIYLNRYFGYFLFSLGQWYEQLQSVVSQQHLTLNRRHLFGERLAMLATKCSYGNRILMASEELLLVTLCLPKLQSVDWRTSFPFKGPDSHTATSFDRQRGPGDASLLCPSNAPHVAMQLRFPTPGKSSIVLSVASGRVQHTCDSPAQPSSSSQSLSLSCLAT